MHLSVVFLHVIPGGIDLIATREIAFGLCLFHEPMNSIHVPLNMIGNDEALVAAFYFAFVLFLEGAIGNLNCLYPISEVTYNSSVFKNVHIQVFLLAKTIRTLSIAALVGAQDILHLGKVL